MKSMGLFVWAVLLQIMAACGALVASNTTVCPFDTPDFCSLVITPACNTTFSYIDQLNEGIRPSLSKLVETSFFRHFKLDLDKQCKFWDAEHFCATENCAVEVLSPAQYNWSHITNDNLKPSKLGQINRASEVSDSAETAVDICEDLDYTYIDDGHHCVHVNLLVNPERFTGYGGNQSLDVWKAIYSENCFPNTNPMSASPGGEPEQCEEKNIFYRLVSGMHASIAVHISNEYLCPSGEFGPNLRAFMERVGSFNDRISNIYFNYALVSQAIVKLSESIDLNSFIEKESGQDQSLYEESDGEEYKNLLGSMVPSLGEKTLFNSSKLFDPEKVTPGLKDEFRSRFRNVSAIMDCVGCDRCRMWGKLQIIGYGTAFKILFESEDPKNASKLKYRRIELVALINTFDKLSQSIEAIGMFKDMYMKHLEDVRNGLAAPGDYDKIHAEEGFEFPFFSSNQAKTSTKKANALSASSSKSKTKASSPPYEVSTASNSSMKYQIFTAIAEVKSATIFVLKSYINFPKSVLKIALFYFNYYWNVFIGKPQPYEIQQQFQLHDQNTDHLNWLNH